MLCRFAALPGAVVLTFAAAFAGVSTAEDKPQPIEIAQADLGRPVEFAKDVLPILQRNCLACHNATEAESDLVLESPETILKGGSEGPAAVAGDGEKSLVLKLAAHRITPAMPPKDNKVGAKPLTPEELGVLKKWIDEGAKADAAGAVAGPIQWQPLPPGEHPIYAVAISPDGNYAACSRANQIFIYHVPSGQEVGRLTDPELLKSGLYKNPGVAHLDLVQSLAFDPTGQLLASGGYRTVKLWRRPSNPQKLELSGAGEVTAVAISSDGKLAATGDKSGAIKLWELASGKNTATLSGHSGEVRGLAFSADAKQLVSGSADKTIRAWDVGAAKELASAPTLAEVNDVALVLGGTQVATAEQDNTIRLWPVPGTAKAEEKPAEEEKKDGDSNAENSDAEAKDEPPKPLKELKGHGGPVTSLAVIDAEGKNLLSGSQDGSVRHWNVENGGQVRQMNQGSPVSSVAVSADGKRFASAGGGNVAKLYNAENGQDLAQLKGDYRRYEQVALLGRQVELSKTRVKNRQEDLKEAEDRKKKEEENEKKAGEALTKAAEEMKKKEEESKKPIADKEAADKELAEAMPVAKKTAEEKTAAETVAKQAGEDQTKANEAKNAADKVANDANAAQQKAQQEKTNKENELKQSQDKVKAADEALKKAKEALDKDAQNQGLIDAHKAAEKALADAQAEEKTRQDALAAAVKLLEEADKAKKDADDKQAAAAKVAEEAGNKKKQADEALAAANKAAQEADQKLKTAENKVKQVKGPFDKATGELASATNAHEAAMRSVAAAKDSVQKAGEAIPVAQKFIDEAQQRQKQLEATLAEAQKSVGESEKPLHGVAFSPDGWRLAVAGEDGLVHIYGAETGAAVDVYEGHGAPVALVAYAPGGTLLATSTSGKSIVWNTAADWRLERTIGGPDKPGELVDRVLALDFSPDGKLLATGSGEPSRTGQLKLWNPADGTLVREIPDAHSDTIFCVEFSPEGDLIATCAADRFAKVFEVASGKFVRAFEGHTHHVLGVSWERTGRVLATGGADQQVKLWDPRTGDQKRSNIKDLGKEVTSLNYAGYGNQFLVSTGNGIVRLYNSDGNQVRNFGGVPGDFVYNTAASDDGKIIAAGGQDGVLRLWNADNGQTLRNIDPPKPAAADAGEQTAAAK